jgi:hypothetical protein
MDGSRTGELAVLLGCCAEQHCTGGPFGGRTAVAGIEDQVETLFLDVWSAASGVACLFVEPQ